jgi:hypothetical protein
MPDTPDPLAPLEHRNVFIAGSAQHHGRTDTTEACTNDRKGGHSMNLACTESAVARRNAQRTPSGASRKCCLPGERA